MWIRFRCDRCGGGIKVDGSLTGRRVRCPLCLNATKASVAPVADEVTRAAQPALAAAVVQSRTQTGVAVLDTGTAAIIDIIPAPQPPRKKKKRKKGRRYHPENEPEGMEEWLKGLIILGVTVGVLVLAAVIASVMGHVLDVVGLVILSVVMLPISLVGVAISMAIVSAIVGGINFGDIKAVIPKLIALVLIANVLRQVPYFGMILAALTWLIGLVALFRLEGYEIGILVLVNWGLGWVIRIIGMLILASAMSRLANPGAIMPHTNPSGPDGIELPAGDPDG